MLDFLFCTNRVVEIFISPCLHHLKSFLLVFLNVTLLFRWHLTDKPVWNITYCTYDAFHSPPGSTMFRLTTHGLGQLSSQVCLKILNWEKTCIIFSDEIIECLLGEMGLSNQSLLKCADVTIHQIFMIFGCMVIIPWIYCSIHWLQTCRHCKLRCCVQFIQLIYKYHKL